LTGEDPHVQTRSEDGGLGYFTSITAAMKEAERDHSIWKISWADATSGDQIRLVRNTKLGAWVYEPLVPLVEMEVRRLGDIN
jgi:hypothetical protein